MSKTTDDVIDKILGAANALRGVRGKLSPQPVPAQVEVVTPAAPPAEVSQEDYDHAKKVIAELKASVEQLEAEVKKDSKEPDAPKSGGETHGKETSKK